VLDQNALARLSNIAAAKPEKARMLENTIIQMARLYISVDEFIFDF
jgi:DNA-binding TFAR19-related protein (PDSD5 family)